MVEFFLPVRGEDASAASGRASRGRVPEVSLHTAVKGQFGLGTGRAMGKALKKFPRSVLRQDIKTCRGDRRAKIYSKEKTLGTQLFLTRILHFAVALTLCCILLSLLVALLTPYPLPGNRRPLLTASGGCRHCQRPLNHQHRHHGLGMVPEKKMAPVEKAKVGDTQTKT